MTKYLSSQPFSIPLGSANYSEGWDRIFGKRDADSEQGCPCHAYVEGEKCVLPFRHAGPHDPGKPTAVECCHGVIPNTFVACGEGGNYCSDECLWSARAARWKRAAKEYRRKSIGHRSFWRMALDTFQKRAERYKAALEYIAKCNGGVGEMPERAREALGE